MTPTSEARVGPNAVIQLVAALDNAGLADACTGLFEVAAVTGWLGALPDAMVDERPVARLHQTVRAVLPDRALAVLADAGSLTADYILANRLPRPVQHVLKVLPAPIAARVLMSAIKAHAWTFAGSGRLAGHVGKTAVLEITGNPFCAGEHAATPVCAWHLAVFQRLFEVLVARRARATQTACEARGDACCRFEVSWSRHRAFRH